MATLAQRFVSAATAVTLLGLSTACSKAAATVPTAVLVNEDRSGTVQMGGQDIKTFTVNYTYDYSPASVTVKSLTSAATGAALSITIGVAFGSLDTFDGSCTRRAPTRRSPLRSSAWKTAPPPTFSAGPYCIAVFDAGTLTEPVNYTVTVKHY